MNSSELRMKTEVDGLHFRSKNTSKTWQNISEHFKMHFKERNSSDFFFSFLVFLIKKKMDRIYL